MKKDLRIVLKVDAKTGQITKVSNSFSKLDRKVQKSRSRLAGFKNDLLKFGGAAIGIYAVKKAFDSIQSDFKTLENASLEVAKTTGLTGDSLKTLTDRLDEMSVTLNGFEIVGLYDIAAAAGQLGIKGVDNIATFTKEMQYMASSSTLSAEEAADGFAKLANTLALPISEINKLTGSFSGLAATTTATEKDLLNFTQRLAGAGKNLGLTNAEIVGIGASLQDVGVNFEVGGTSISKMFLKMLTDGEKFAKVSGVSFEEYAKTLNDEPLKAVNDLLTSLGKMDKTSKITALKYLQLDSAQAANTLLKLSGSVENLNKNIATSNAEYAKGDATLNEYLISSTSLEQAQMKNANASMLFGRTIGSFLKPVMLGLNDVSTTVFNHITKMIGKEATEATGVFGKALIDMANSSIQALRTLVDWITTVASGFRIAVAGYNKLRGAIGMQLYGTQQENAEKLKSLELEKKIAQQKGHGVTLVNADIRALKEKVKLSKEYTDIRKGGDQSLDDIVAFQTKVDGLSTKIKALKIDYRQVMPSKEVVGATNDTEDLIEKLKEGTTSFKNFGTTAGKSGGKIGKALKSTTKEADTLYKKYLELTGQQEKLFQMDVDKTLGEMVKSGKYTAEQIGESYNGMWKSFSDGADKGTQKVKTLSEALGSFDSGFGGLFDGIANGDIGSWVKGLMGSGLDMIMPGLGSALGAIGSLFSSTVSQAEIDASKGRVEFSDDSLRGLEGVFEGAQYPMLDVTNKMYKHIRNMDANFYSIARAFSSEASRGGIDLTGANFVDTMEIGFLGFSSKAISLIGTGLQFELQNLSEMMNAAELDVRSYTTTLVEKSSWWGLKKSSSIEETYKNLPSGVVDEMADAFTDGYEAIMIAGVSLGLNEASLAGALDLAYVDLGKIDFTGLSEDEIADRLSQAFSTAFSGVVDQIPALNALVDRYVQGTEESLETLGRIAVEYDQSSHMFSLIEKDFATVFNRSLINVIDGMNFYMVEAYTVQEQMLDIVKSTGGLTEFQDAMGAFMGGFYTETEQLDFMIRSMEESFGTLGLIAPKTNEEFKNLMESIDTSTESGTYLYGQVLLLAEGFNAMTDAAENLESSIESTVTTLNDESLILRHTGAYTSFEQAAINRQGDADASALYAINAANAVLQDTIDLTGIYSVNADNYLSRFEAARYGGLTDEQLSDWVQLGSAITALENAADSWEDAIARESEAADKEYIDRITRAYTGDISPLGSFGKADYFSMLANVQKDDGNTAGYLDALESQLQQIKKMSATEEDYSVYFEKYSTEINKNKPKKTTDDLYAKMNEVLVVLRANGHATTAASFQQEFTS